MAGDPLGPECTGTGASSQADIQTMSMTGLGIVDGLPAGSGKNPYGGSREYIVLHPRQ
jgi:hypothetical protein